MSDNDDDTPTVIFLHPPEESERQRLDRIAGKDPRRRAAIRRWAAPSQTNGDVGKLDSITLMGPSVKDDHLRDLELFPEVKDIGFVDAAVTDAGVAILVRFPKLISVGIIRCPNVTDAVGQTLSQLKNVEALDFLGTPIGDGCVAKLPLFSKLGRLELGDTLVTSVSLEYVARLPELTVLFLARTKINDDGLKHLAEMHTLRDLWIHDTEITDCGIAHLRTLTAVKSLLLRDTQIGDASLDVIANFTDLRSLDIARTRVTNKGVASLAGLRKLSHLSLDGTDVDDLCIPDLLRIQSLKGLSLKTTNISKEGIERLRAALAGRCWPYSDFDPVEE
jgi:internalin A